MKIKTVPTTKLALFWTALVVAWFMLSDRASAVSIRDAHELGLVQFGASSRHSDGSTYINNLIGMALRSHEMANGRYFPSDNSMRRVVLPDHINAGRSVGVITTPIIGGAPKPGSGAVPDGGITAMLLGGALGVLGIARRYLRT
jgi:protein with PEP-CTERM/exosortase system signal